MAIGKLTIIMAPKIVETTWTKYMTLILPDVGTASVVGGFTGTANGVGADSITGARVVPPIPLVGMSVLVKSVGVSLVTVDGCTVPDGVLVVLGDTVTDGPIVGGIVTFVPFATAGVGTIVMLPETADGAGTPTGAGTATVGAVGATGESVELVNSGVTVGNSGIS